MFYFPAFDLNFTIITVWRKINCPNLKGKDVLEMEWICSRDVALEIFNINWEEPTMDGDLC
jgi:hypothetical protein